MSTAKKINRTYFFFTNNGDILCVVIFDWWLALTWISTWFTY